MPVLYGLTAMLWIAAFIEAFWSSKHGIDSSVKYWVGAAMWISIVSYLGLAGRSGGA